MEPQNEFLVQEISVKMDEQGFFLVMKKGAPNEGELDSEIRAKIPAKALLKFILVLFQAGQTYQRTFGANIGFPYAKGEKHEERATEHGNV